jgi:hypothetical protein
MVEEDVFALKADIHRAGLACWEDEQGLRCENGGTGSLICGGSRLMIHQTFARTLTSAITDSVRSALGLTQKRIQLEKQISSTKGTNIRDANPKCSVSAANIEKILQYEPLHASHSSDITSKTGRKLYFRLDFVHSLLWHS